MKAVIMAGGRGTRIAALAGNLPKPMLPIDGRPVLERELGSLREQGVTEELKARDPMKWVQLMNNLRNAAEETILTELIYS